MIIGSTERKLNSIFGVPYLKNGKVDPAWEKKNLAYIKLPYPMYLSWDMGTQVTRIRVHRLLVDEFTQGFNTVWAAARMQVKKTFGFKQTSAFYDQKARELLHQEHLDIFGGSYMFRNMIGKDTISHHAYGIALDFDPRGNPLGHKNTTFPKWFSDCWLVIGCIWGKNFRRRPDPMHFEINHN